MAEFRKISGEKLLRILCNKFNFEITGKRGSHVRISRFDQRFNRKIGSVIPMHDELRIGTLKAILKQVSISEDEIKEFL